MHKEEHYERDPRELPPLVDALVKLLVVAIVETIAIIVVPTYRLIRWSSKVTIWLFSHR